MQRLILPFLFSAAILVAQEAAVVPVDQEPAHHLAIENQYLRVFDVVVSPYASTLMHRHDRDYVFVTLGDSDINNERLSEKPIRLVLKDGEVRYSKGGFSHLARNLAETPFHNITIELKNPGAPICGIESALACESDSKNQIIQKLFSTEHVSASLTTLHPGQEGPPHAHDYPHLALAVDDLTLENHVADKPAKTISMKKGEFVWVSNTGFTHYFKNVGNTRARMLSLEFH